MLLEAYNFEIKLCGVCKKPKKICITSFNKACQPYIVSESNWMRSSEMLFSETPRNGYGIMKQKQLNLKLRIH